MARKLNEQELHELFQENLPPVTLPPLLSMQLRERVLAEVNSTLQPPSVGEDDLLLPDREVSPPSGVERSRQRSAPSWREQLGNWIPRLRPATSMLVAAATVAALVVFVVMIPRLLPGVLDTTPETGAGTETLPVVQLPETDDAALYAQVVVAEAAAKIQRAGSDTLETVSAESSAQLEPGDTLITQDGSAEITYFPNQATTLAPNSQVLLATLADNNDGTQVLLQMLAGTTRHSVATSLSPEDQFEVQTPLATASVVSANFETTIQDDETTLVTAYEGQVVVTRNRDGAVAEVGADQQLAVGAEGALVVSPLSATTEVVQVTESEPSIVTSMPTETEDPAVTDTETMAPLAPTATNTPQTIALGSADDTKTATPRPTETRAPASGNSSTPATSTVAEGRNPTAPTPTRTPTATQVQSSVGSATSTPTKTATNTPTRTSVAPGMGIVGTATATQRPTNTPKPTATRIMAATSTATASRIPTKTVTPTATKTITPLPTKTPLPTATSTVTQTPTPVPTVTPLNRAPSAQGDTFRTREDNQDSYIPVLINDSDPDFDTLKVVDVGAALHGTATIAGPGAIYYLPDPDFSGTDTFTYTISDGELTSTATISVTVQAVNDAPRFTLSRDSVIVNEDAGAQTISGMATSISAGPGDEVNQNLTFTPATDSNHLFAAAPTIDPSSGTLTFTAMPNANGTAIVSVGLRDDGGTANGGVDSAPPQTFSIVISPVNDAPGFALNESRVVVDEDAGSMRFPAWATEISAGPSNESAQALRFEIGVDNSEIFAESPAIDAQTGDLTFVTQPNIHGQSTVTVVLVDEGGARSEARTFTIVVNPINDAPGFSLPNDRLEVNEDAGQQVVPGWATNIHAGAPNEASQPLRFEVTADNGALFSTPPTINSASGDLTFATKLNGYGESNVAATLVDEGGARSEVRTFRIVVNPINDAPRFTLSEGPIEINANEGAKRFSNWATSISAGAANESDQSLTFKLTVELTNGTERLFEQKPAIDVTSGELTFTTLENVGGSATVTVRLVETAGGGLASEPQTFTIQVNAVEEEPAAQNDMTAAGAASPTPDVDNQDATDPNTGD